MSAPLRLLSCGFTIWLMVFCAARADSPAAPPAPADAAPTAAPDLLVARRHEVSARLAAAERALDQEKEASSSDSASLERHLQEIDLLRQLEALYAQLKSAQAARDEMTAAKAEFQRQLDQLHQKGVDQPRPYSFLLLDGYQDSIATETSRLEAIRAMISGAASELDRAKAADDEQQADRRRLKEAVERGSASQHADRAAQLSLGELAANVSEQKVAVRRAELDNARAAEEAHKVHLKLLEETVALVAPATVFAEYDLQKLLAQLDEEENDATRELKAAEDSLAALDRQWTEARKQVDGAAQVKASLVEEAQAAKLARDCQNRKIYLLQRRLELLGHVSEAWRRRYAVNTGRFEIADIHEWTAESAADLDQLNYERHACDLFLDQTRKELADLDQRLDGVKEHDAELAGAIRKEQELYQQFIDVVNGNLVKLDSQSKLHQKLLDEIRQKTEHRSLGQWLAAAKQTLLEIANQEVARSDDESITIGKIVGALALLVLGVAVSRWITRLVGRRVVARLGIHAGAALALQSLGFYGLVVASALGALHMVHVPLTIFAFMGGAIAIGVGFGSQKILNNFISGLILLIEQPIRVGDVIELGTLQGTVEAIGTRSTKIRTGSNFEIIVPNSSFLENNVVNWTLADSTIRSTIRVGLAYGSPTREAAALLKRAADEHPLILRKPEPFVLFADFADNSLNFELYFWIDLHLRADRRRVESDLRFEIEQLFATAGITIAFPQRDIHLDQTRPLEVSLLPPAQAVTPTATQDLRAA